MEGTRTPTSARLNEFVCIKLRTVSWCMERDSGVFAIVITIRKGVKVKIKTEIIKI
jgi:hypothetical protein